MFGSAQSSSARELAPRIRRRRRSDRKNTRGQLRSIVSDMTSDTTVPEMKKGSAADEINQGESRVRLRPLRVSTNSSDATSYRSASASRAKFAIQGSLASRRPRTKRLRPRPEPNSAIEMARNAK